MLQALKKLDWILMGAIILLVAIGLLSVASASQARIGDFSSFKKQLIFISVGFAAAFAMAIFDYRALRSMVRLLYVGGLILLAAVLIFGTTIRGTRGWFVFSDLTLQPVEIAKVILTIALARFLSVRAHVVDLKVLGGAVLLGIGYAGLTILQPDLGSAFVLLSLVAGLLFLTLIPWRYILGFFSVFIIMGVLAWTFFFKDYQKARLVSLINPRQDPLGQGYNIRQSIIAVGAGRILGRGLGEGSQSQLRFLPEAQTDFVFAVLAEQFGFLVVTLILMAYGLIIWRLTILARRANDGFALFCIAGFFIILAVQVTLNVGMNLGLLPIVGLSLPFLSYGGSAILSNFLFLGIVQSIKVRI